MDDPYQPLNEPDPLAGRDDPENARLDMLFDTPRVRSFSDLINRTFELFGANFRIIFVVTLALIFPMDVLVAFADIYAASNNDLHLISSLGSIIQQVLYAVATPAIIYAMILQQREARAVTLSEALGWGGKAWLRTLGYRILVGLILFAGFIFFLIPGLIFLTWFALVDVVVAVEGRNHAGVLSRSKFLTEGHRWRILGCYLFMGPAILAVGCGFQLGIDAFSQTPGTVGAVFMFPAAVASAVVSAGLSLVVWVFTALSVVIYLDGVSLHLIDCPNCQYNLTGNTSGSCPECGEPISPYVQSYINRETAEPWDRR